MYAFYSLLVYIFYTVFKKEEEEDALEGAHGGSSDVCLAKSWPDSKWREGGWTTAGKIFNSSTVHAFSPWLFSVKNLISVIKDV